jgi:hypothetical protein
LLWRPVLACFFPSSPIAPSIIQESAFSLLPWNIVKAGRKHAKKRPFSYMEKFQLLTSSTASDCLNKALC